MKSKRLLPIFVLFVFTFVTIDAYGRGRGRSGGGGARSSRPASRPASRPSSRPSGIRSSDKNRKPNSRLSNSSSNRSPSLSDRSRLSNSNTRPSNGTQQARDRAMANPKTRPLYQGTPAARRSAADQRLGTAVRNGPGRSSSRSQIAAAQGKTRATRGNAVRRNVNPARRNVFNKNWVSNHRARYPQRWHYWNHHHPVSRWWRWATWASLTTWVVYDWGSAYDYDYDGTVYLDDDVVYADDEAVAAYEDYVASAEELANAEDPAADAEMDWESLGTWALSTDRDHSNSNMMIQLVLSKDGHVGGTYYNTTTDNTQRIHGSLDQATQRLAFQIGETSTTVLEVGLSNLTENEAPIWAHFTTKGTTQTWLLVRLEEPEGVDQ